VPRVQDKVGSLSIEPAFADVVAFARMWKELLQSMH
jgi:hypothetical protein